MNFKDFSNYTVIRLMNIDTLKQKSTSHSPFQWHSVTLNQRSYECPSARWGHSMVLAENNIYVFGGYAG